MSNRKKRLVIVDDEPDLLLLLQKVLEKKCGCRVDIARSGAEALTLVTEEPADVILTDVNMPHMSGFQLLENIKKLDETITILVMSAYGTIEVAVQALKQGAYDFFEKPFDNTEIVRVVQRAFERTELLRENKALQRYLTRVDQSSEFIGSSPALMKAVALLNRLGQGDATVLIRGESGTGKEVAARTIHARSSRAGRRMITVNCPALPEQILESELFGYSKGAFTGADRNKDGLFLEADGSTILLDEIADIPIGLQTKLLRVLQEKEIQPLGQTRTFKVDVRVLASTNQNLEAKIARGEFREDLYYRLNVMSVTLPSLARMREDIPLLARHFLARYGAEYQRPDLEMSPDALQSLMSREWRGNVRELQNVINRTVFLAPGPLITAADLLCAEGQGAGSEKAPECVFDELRELSYKEAKAQVVGRFAMAYLGHCLQLSGGNISAAAKASGMERQAFQRLMRRYDLKGDDYKSP
ncbi:MAG: sigma-54-dependent Fis family transcriptional regulator [Desulfobulbaceae bacterium]|uniref:Sigma-54-dependent Fis family transcriptional regulator n=1 Tax=Candidatus Desulfatifera sulfidica TaxID=2841691 RepID=A0A8J6TEG8_9BACT|nr:sigma-54-dependent Fis family transcriptional regulator [Candidatus Desulfatifera sulfidica]